MKFDPKTTFTPAEPQEFSADPICTFVSAHYEGLWHAARLLGGYEAARLVDRCQDLLVLDGRLTSRTRLMLGQVLAILSLETVDDPALPYMGYFAVIDPFDPVVEEICLLTDGLRDVLERPASDAARAPEIRAA
ncbi:hypothetical protein ACOI1H_13740 [Loktanella sp. DJP18]|uniref:hypothetical protein n=1 Tax=Loktanella sp. DJP18 TaxID=3409788 RepID=UPI003BB7E89D